MKVIFGIGKIKKRFPRPVLAIGVFDGLHRGHQYLIKKMVDKARRLKGTSMVMTFFPHPLHVLQPSLKSALLVSLSCRIKLIEALNVDACVVVNFTKRFSRLSAHQFIKRYLLTPISPREVFVGDDFRFGRKRSGSIELLKKCGQAYGFKVNAIAAVKKNGRIIRSTLIRNLLKRGKLDEAREFLGRPVSIAGEVTRGDNRGGLLGFPTANIDPPQNLILPFGVYFVEAAWKKKTFAGMANVGKRPSFKTDNKVNVEVHIFDFNKNIYGQKLEIKFIKKIRDEKKFASRQELAAQLKCDEQNIRAMMCPVSNLP